MRTTPSGRRSARALHLALVASMLAVVTPTIASPQVATASGPSTWIASGPANVTTDSNGLITPAQMSYSLVYDPANPVDGSQARYTDQTWTLSTTASSGFTGTVPYTYTGFHAFFQVQVHVDAFVTHNYVTTSVRLVDDGPIDCCTHPSGGFSYTGSHFFHVEVGVKLDIVKWS